MAKQPKGRRQGCEKYLLAESIELCRGQKPKSYEYLKSDFNNPVKSVGSTGSNNWDRIALACRIADPDSVKQWGINPFDDLREVIEESKRQWGGRELDSTTYEAFTGGSDLVIQKMLSRSLLPARVELYNSISEHNRYRAARFGLLRMRRHLGLLGVGQRSAGGVSVPGTSWNDRYMTIGMNYTRPNPMWTAMNVNNRRRPSGYPPLFYLSWAHDELLKIWEPFRTMRMEYLDYLRTHKRNSRVPVYVMETIECKSVWQPRSIHGATEAVLAAVEYKNGEVLWGPIRRGGGPNGEHDPGRKSRHGGGSVCSLEHMQLQYVSLPPRGGRPPVYENVNIPIIGSPIKFWEIGGTEGFKDLLSLGIRGTVVSREEVEDSSEFEPEDISSWERFTDYIKELFG